MIWHAFRTVRPALEHLPISIVVGLTLHQLTGSGYLILAALLGGWLIDADHLIDYFLFCFLRGNKPRLADFLKGTYFQDSGKVILPLHSLEISFIVILVGYVFDCSHADFLLSFGLAHSLHLAQDQLQHRPHKFGYFIMWRLSHNFATHKFCNQYG